MKRVLGILCVAFILMACSACTKGIATLSTNATNGQTYQPWCKVDPKQDQRDDWVGLESATVRVVVAKQQDAANAALAHSTHMRISVKKAVDLSGNTIFLHSDTPVYLVRAGAFFDGRDYQWLESTFKVMYSPSSRMLSVINFSLSPRASEPKGVDLIIQTNVHFHGYESLCATAE